MILVINPGSSSLKAKLYDSAWLNEVASFSKAQITAKTMPNAINELLRELHERLSNIHYVAYRVVLAGEDVINGEEIRQKQIDLIKTYSRLAPLHNTPALQIINYVMKKIPQAKHVAVYDTAFYQNLPVSEIIYPLPENVIKDLHLKKYGYHGISHQYAFYKSGMSKYGRVITIHLGAGCSVTAIRNGSPIATSMGITPLGGVVMESRTGDLDPGIILEMVGLYGLKKTKFILENESGLRGLNEGDGNMFLVLHMAGYPIEDPDIKIETTVTDRQKEKAILSLDIYCQSIRDKIAAYSSRMQGVDSLVFTGKIGNGSSFLRNKITYGLDFLNLKEVVYLKPDEELAIAEIVKNKYY